MVATAHLWPRPRPPASGSARCACWPCAGRLHACDERSPPAALLCLHPADTVFWDPACDPFLAACYDAARQEGKALCKRFLQEVGGWVGGGGCFTGGGGLLWGRSPCPAWLHSPCPAAGQAVCLAGAQPRAAAATRCVHGGPRLVSSLWPNLTGFAQPAGGSARPTREGTHTGGCSVLTTIPTAASTGLTMIPTGSTTPAVLPPLVCRAWACLWTPASRWWRWCRASCRRQGPASGPLALPPSGPIAPRPCTLCRGCQTPVLQPVGCLDC